MSLYAPLHQVICLLYQMLYVDVVALQIYSIVGGVMRVTLFTMAQQHQVNVNEELILYGFAEPFEESIVSKVISCFVTD